MASPAVVACAVAMDETTMATITTTTTTTTACYGRGGAGAQMAVPLQSV